MKTSQNPDYYIELMRWIRTGEARRIREASGLARSHLALRLDVTPSALGRWEKGEREPQGRNARDYHKILTKLMAALEKP